MPVDFRCPLSVRHQHRYPDSGVHWWKWFTDAASQERDDCCPMGMRAEGMISRWWGEEPTP
ncbi:MAG: hypothetical protein P8R54_22180 [Myxococcota bacterium]|nr:hypothetical protein [Myxococcota bacterium]